MTTTETFVETLKNKFATWTSTITVTKTPATLSERRMVRARWFDYVGDHVTACNTVEVTVDHGSGAVRTETFFEIVTPAGKGCVTILRDHEELDVFIPNSGKPLIYGFWKKHGHMVGHAGYYVRANRVNASSRTKVDHTCPARIYAAAVGKTL